MPLGVLPFPAYEEETVTLEAGGAVVLYTDGLIERRGEHLDDGTGARWRAPQATGRSSARRCATGCWRPWYPMVRRATTSRC